MTLWRIISGICATILMLAALGSILWKAFEIHDAQRDAVVREAARDEKIAAIERTVNRLDADVRILNPAGPLYPPTEVPPDPEMYILYKLNADGDTVDVDTTWGEP